MTETSVITCTCTVCNGLSARIKGDGKTFANGVRIGPTMVHNLVRIAHSPLAKAASTVQSGPWPV